MKKIYITRKLRPAAYEILSRHFEVEQNLGDEALTKKQLIDVVNSYDGVLSTLADPFDEEVLCQSTQLKVISNCAAGLDNIDQKAALSKGIKVLNVPYATTDSTADLTFAILLSLIRKVIPAAQYVKDGLWKGWDPALFLGQELSGKTLGILGYGHIGKAVAKRAAGFNLKVIAHSRTGFVDTEEVQSVSLETLYAESDYLSLHVPLTEKTHKLLNQQAFMQMKKKPVIINMARGKVIVTEDLLEALNHGWIQGAALDVTDPEPVDGTHLLCHYPNVLILPHIGSATTECREQMARQSAQNLVNYFL